MTRDKTVGTSHASGFTLIELMIVLAIAATLLVMVVPSFQNQILNSRMSAATSDLLGSFMSAKAESSGRSDFVTVCKRNVAGSGCVTSGNWDQGWLTFVDSDGDGVVDGGEQIIQIHRALPEGTTARGTAQIANLITYRPNGMTSLTATQTLVLCDKRGFGDFARGVVVSILGKGSILKAADAGQGDCL